MSVERPRILEVKRHLDGRESSFECELVDERPGRVIVCFHLDRLEGSLTRYDIGEPLDSYGFFWKRRPYNCYYLAPARLPLGSPPVLVRFDVSRDVEFVERSGAPDEIRFLDLELDLLVTPDGARWEDEDEVERAEGAGLLSPSDLVRIERARRTLLPSPLMLSSSKHVPASERPRPSTSLRQAQAGRSGRTETSSGYRRVIAEMRRTLRGLGDA